MMVFDEKEVQEQRRRCHDDAMVCTAVIMAAGTALGMLIWVCGIHFGWWR